MATINNLLFKTKRKLLDKICNIDSFLSKCTGVVHIGANTGQERFDYAELNLNVAWIEPIHGVFETLRENVRHFENQKALNYLISDQDGQVCSFNIASNDGASSSMLNMKHHGSIWPDIQYTATIEMTSTTLSTLISSGQIDLRLYDALVLDTQGSELKVAQGCGEMLHAFRYVKCELPDFEAYEGCCDLESFGGFMKSKGFREMRRFEFERGPLGSYYDVVYKNSSVT